MKDLLKAIKLVKEWNQKPFNEVVKAVEDYLEFSFDEAELEEWRFTGLNNVDFIKLKIGEEDGKK